MSVLVVTGVLYSTRSDHCFQVGKDIAQALRVRVEAAGPWFMAEKAAYGGLVAWMLSRKSPRFIAGVVACTDLEMFWGSR